MAAPPPPIYEPATDAFEAPAPYAYDVGPAP
jgi:hypothetical protein